MYKITSINVREGTTQMQTSDNMLILVTDSNSFGKKPIDFDRNSCLLLIFWAKRRRTRQYMKIRIFNLFSE